MNSNGELQRRQREHTCRDQALRPWRRSLVWSSVTFWHIPFSTGESPTSSALCPCTGHGSSLPKVVSGHAASSPAASPWTPAPTGVSSVGGAHPGEGPTPVSGRLVPNAGSVAFQPVTLSLCSLPHLLHSPAGKRAVKGPVCSHVLTTRPSRTVNLGFSFQDSLLASRGPSL